MSRRRALLWTLLGPPLCGMVVAGLVTAGWLAIGRPDPLSGETWMRVEQVTAGASYTALPDQPIFFLVVGGDARQGGPSGSLGDSLHLVGVNPALGAATILGFPRDLAVPIPGAGTNKVNSALSRGGLQLQAETISNLTGVPIQYAIGTAFEGFINMVEEFGGIDVNIPVVMNDTDAGTSFQPGPLHLDSHGSLAFARDRKSFSSGDIARSENQGLLMISALTTLHARGTTNSSSILSLLGILGRHTELIGVNLVDFYRFGRLAFSLDPVNIRNVVTPTGGGAGSDLSLGAGAEALFADFRDDAVLQSH